MTGRLTLLQLRALAAIHSGRVDLDRQNGAYSLVGPGARMHLAFDAAGTVDAYLAQIWAAHTQAFASGRPLVQKNDRIP